MDDSKILTVEVCRKRAVACDLCGGRAVIDLSRLDGHVLDGDFPRGDVGGHAGGLLVEFVVCRVVAGDGEAGKGHGLSRTDVLVVERRLAGHDADLVAADQAVERACGGDLRVGRGVVDLACDGHAGDGEFLRVNLKGHRRGGRLEAVALGQRDADGVEADVLRRGGGVGGVVRVGGFVLIRCGAVGIGVVDRYSDGVSVVGLAVVGLMVDGRRLLADDQLERQLCRGLVAFAFDVFLAHGVKGDADVIFACGEGAEVAIVQRGSAGRVARVVAVLAELLRPVVNRCDAVAIQLHREGDILVTVHDEGRGFVDLLRVGIEDDALGVDNGHITALVGHADVDDGLLLRLDVEPGCAILHVERRPVAGDGIGTCKGSRGQKVFHRYNAAARVGGGHGDGLRFLEEQAEGDGVQEGVELVRADGNFRLGRGDVGHAGHRDMQLTFDRLIEVGGRVGLQGLAVHLDLEAVGLGVALGDRHGEAVALAVIRGREAVDGVARAGRLDDRVGLHDGDGNGRGVACDVRSSDDVGLIVLRDHIAEGTANIAGGDVDAVHRYDKFIVVVGEELRGVIVSRAVFNVENDRSGRIGRGDIAAAAELFVRGSDPAAVMLVRDNGNVREDRIAAVGDLAAVIIPVTQSVCEAVDGTPAVDSEMTEGDARIERGVGRSVDITDFGGRDLDGVALARLNAQGAAGFGDELRKFTGIECQFGVGLHRDVAGKLHAVMDIHLAAGLHEGCAVDTAAAGAVQHCAVIYGDQAGSLAAVQAASAAEIQGVVQGTVVHVDIVASGVQGHLKG